MWTIRFEGKHSFFKNVIHETQNFLMARRHQKMMTYHLDSPSFFKPELQVQKVKSAMLTSFPKNIKDFVQQTYGARQTVLLAATVTVNGVQYAPGMVVSVG